MLSVLSSSLWVLITVLILSVLLTGLYRRWAIKRDWLEHPNHRSSHITPIPGGAGMVLLLIYVVGFVALFSNNNSMNDVLYWGCPLVMGGLGVLDDRLDLSRSIRFLIYAILLVLALLAKGVNLGVQIFNLVIEMRWLMYGVLVILLLWWVNLFNFMDGINGIAGFQCVFVLLAAMGLAPNVGNTLSNELSLLVVGSVAGLLIWNFPQAKVFMGDAGSIFLGAFIGLLAVQSDLSIWVWGVLLGVFFVDASYTLLVRAMQGQKWYQAHRSHAYQILSRRWNSHSKVVVATMSINILWLLPLAYYASLEVYYAPLIMLLAWLPLVSFSYVLGAGSRER